MRVLPLATRPNLCPFSFPRRNHRMIPRLKYLLPPPFQALHLDVHLREMLPPRYIGDAVLEDAYGAASADRLVGLFKSGRMPLGFGHLAHM